jgi:hypothetical protein
MNLANNPFLMGDPTKQRMQGFEDSASCNHSTKAGGIEIQLFFRTPKTLLLAQYITTQILVFN